MKRTLEPTQEPTSKAGKKRARSIKRGVEKSLEDPFQMIGYSLWSLLRGTILWITWLDRNALTFQADHWTSVKVEIIIWEATSDHVWVAWKNLSTGMRHQPNRLPRLLQKFDDAWCSSPMFCSHVDQVVTWNISCPRLGTFR
jgi:hypothetical protein